MAAGSGGLIPVLDLVLRALRRRPAPVLEVTEVTDLLQIEG